MSEILDSNQGAPQPVDEAVTNGEPRLITNQEAVELFDKHLKPFGFNTNGEPMYTFPEMDALLKKLNVRLPERGTTSRPRPAPSHYFLGHPVYTQEQLKDMDPFFPPEPEWAAEYDRLEAIERNGKT